MKLMFPEKPFIGVCLTLTAFILAFSFSAAAQTKKAKPSAKTPTKTVAKKTTNPGRDAKKAPAKKATEKKATAKSKARDTRSAKQPAKKNSKDSRAVAAKDKNSKKSKAETKKEAAERRRKEAERRAAILAEQRRREAARRAAIARAIAFENGLRTETAANIAKDNTEGEDLKIRQAAVNALGNNAGSVVVMEAQTGKILTIVNQDWAVRSGVKPCSTIKLVTGVAGVNEKAIAKDDGSLTTSTHRMGLDDALAHSKNGYFQYAGSAFGRERMVEYARKMGLGDATGVNLEGEYVGKVPLNNDNPRIYSHGDDFDVTGVQLAVMVSAIANGGNRVLPRVPRNEIEKAKFQTFYRGKVDVPRESLRRVIPGMMGAAEYGTARRGMNQDLGVAGKTGSCISKGTWVGLFASVAPIEQPKYAVVVITRGQKQRGRIAAGVAAQIYNTLAPNIVRTDRNLAQTEFKLRPRNQVETTATALAATGDDEDDDAEAANAEFASLPAEGDVPVVSAPSQQRKLVTKTVNSKPVFPPVVITYDKSGKEKKPAPRKQ